MAFKDPARSRAYQRAYQRAYRLRHAGDPRPPRRKTCLVCEQPVGPGGRTYCSNRRQFTGQYRAYIHRWLAGEVSGGSVAGVSDHVRRYLIEQGGELCSRCGWSERHPVTNRVPLEIDHLDGNYANNRPLNVRLLCPNCHALTPTYRALNKGNGRPWAVVRRQA